MTKQWTRPCKGPNCHRNGRYKFSLCHGHNYQRKKFGILTEITTGKRRKAPRSSKYKKIAVDGTEIYTPCSFEPCINKATIKGHCMTHYYQLRRGKELKEIRPYNKSKKEL
jgi:hypothetical protein